MITHCSFYYSPLGMCMDVLVCFIEFMCQREFVWELIYEILSWCIFRVRVWVIHSIFVRETSDFSLVSLDPCSIHHSIYFGCDYFLCFDAGWPLLIFLSLCFFVSLSCSSIPPYLIWFLSFLILLDVLTWVQHLHFILAYPICSSLYHHFWCGNP